MDSVAETTYSRAQDPMSKDLYALPELFVALQTSKFQKWPARYKKNEHPVVSHLPSKLESLADPEVC